MKASELRIGNYIYDDFNEVHIVEKIESQKFNDWNGSEPSLIVFSKLKETQNGMYTCDVVSGIPLTVEWLLKFGFNRHDDGSVSAQFSIGTNPVTKDFMMYLIWIKSSKDYSLKYFPFYRNGHHIIKYVHQLQNLYFALTGKELTTS